MADNNLYEKRAVRTSMAILQRLLRDYHPRDFSIRFWDGSRWESEPGQPALFTLVLRHPGALRSMLKSRGDRALAEAYVYNELDIEGGLDQTLRLVQYLVAGVQLSFTDRMYLGIQLLSLPRRRDHPEGRQSAKLTGTSHSIDRDRQAVTYHYNISNDFFALFLDTRMIYSCAYFSAVDDDLDTAQERKLEYVCRKLRLRPGERLLDIGCGWGGLIMYAAKVHGVSCLGITLSEPQAALANERIRKLGLENQCRVEVVDYRQVAEGEGFDKVVSIGMVEHVGESRLSQYFGEVWRLLRPGGVFLNHGIASMRERGTQSTFSDAYVFPDGEMVTLDVSTQAAEGTGFEVRDVESLREHYALTLRRWIERLESHHEEALQMTDETTYRTWRVFMTGSMRRFEVGELNVYQTLLVKPDHGKSGLPLTRGDWYR